MLKDKKAYCEELISYLGNEKLSVSILFITRDKENDSYEVYKGNLSDEVAKILRGLCLKLSKKSYGKPEKKDFEPYNPSQKISTCTEFLEGKELRQIEPILNLIETKILDLKKLDQKFLDNLWYYVIKFNDGNNTLLFFKKYSKGMVLTKSLGLALTFRSGDFDKLKHDIFMIYNKIDCIYFKNKLIIRSKGNFEKIFDFFQKIKENAQSAINFIENKLPFKIENFKDIKEKWMEHEIKIRKLNNIYTTKILEKIQPENIEPLIKEGILKNVKIIKDEKGMIILSSNDPWEILNILDDDYVKSRLTGINYEAIHKKEIQGK